MIRLINNQMIRFASLKNKALYYFQIIFVVFVLFTGLSVKAQSKQIPDEVQIQIDNYRVNAIKNRNLGNDNAAVTYLNKIAYLYWEDFVYDKAISYFEEVLTINQNLQNTGGQQKVLDNMAFVYSDMERYDLAIEYFNRSQKMLEANTDKVKIASGLNNLASAYQNNGQYSESVNKALRGLDMAKVLNDLKLMRSFYGILYESYDKLGDTKKSVEYFGLYSSIDKMIQDLQYRAREEVNQEKINQMEAQKQQAEQTTIKTQTELVKTRDTLKTVEQISKEQVLSIELLNAQMKMHEAQLKAERRLRYFFMAVFMLLAAIAFLIYWQMQLKRKANRQLKALYNEIEKKNRQILDSISYASHIQEAILPYEKSIKDIFPESFILFKPRDIVSGDFYWYSKLGTKVFIAAIDCTGHGVPGAFMSMIGNTLLSEVINEKEVTDPAEALNLLNQRVIYTLNQDSVDKESFSEDGMDISLCVYDTQNHILELALANHTAVLFKNGVMQMVEGDMYSIGGHVGGFGEVKFTKHTFKVDSLINLYLFSDGFQDQFGGPDNKKFMITHLIQQLSQMQSIPLSQQGKILEETFNNWRGPNRQVDDVLLIGLSCNA